MVAPNVEGIDHAASVLLRAHPRVVLAISGGADSMALLASVGTMVTPDSRVVVATFDHGTGQSARDAVSLVRRVTERFGFQCRVGRATGLPRRESAWRAARWHFLRGVSADERSTIVTAHTQDDHVETVVMRALRDSGTRGLAGLLAESDVVRPLLGFRRADLEGYARHRGVPWVDDPANADLAFLRNRVRHDLLPALTAAHPGFRDQISRLSIRAATLRREIEEIANEVSELDPRLEELSVATGVLAPLTADGLATLWPALLARARAVADRRGIVRIVDWTQRARSGTSVPISGGFEVLKRRDDFLVRRVQSGVTKSQTLAPSGETQVGHWRFYPLDVTTITGSELTSDPWRAALAASPALEVRGWRRGDRMQAHPAAKPRRVARFFEDAGVTGPERRGWPVVAWGDEVVWIPGVRRGYAATARSGGPYVVYQCERNFSRSKT